MLSLPAVLLIDEFTWTFSDFVLAGALLLGAGFAYAWMVRKRGNPQYRAAVGLAVTTALVLVWMNLAVGLIGSEDNPANILYVGVLFVAVIGTSLVRFRPRGMARTMFATAGSQALVPVIAMVIWRPPLTTREETIGILEVFILNGLFVVLFTGSALLFRHAAKQAEGGGDHKKELRHVF